MVNSFGREMCLDFEFSGCTRSAAQELQLAAGVQDVHPFVLYRRREALVKA